MRKLVGVVAVLAFLAAACGGGSGTQQAGGGDGDERTVLIDNRHDQFSSAFFRYYPEKVTIRQGDTVRFKQTWNGEPHSVTLGKVVDDTFKYLPIFSKYDSEEAARADGVSDETIAEVNATFTRLPGMTAEGREIFQAGAQPCFIDDIGDVPAFSTPEGSPNKDTKCPTAGKPQPAFSGRQALYNSGFIPAVGKNANEFVLPVAGDAEPGTYRYFCNYHWVSMSGDINVVAKGTKIPSQLEISRQARKEIDADAKDALKKVREARKVKVGGKIGALQAPLAGRAIGEDAGVAVNEFFPKELTAKVGEKVTWTIDGISHTVSFDVPKYFPIFTVDPNATVEWNHKSYEPVGFDVPAQETNHQEHEPPPAKVDAGTWDGKGGFHSSGALNPGDTFSVAFSKSGTYSYACVLHPQMVGTLVVK